MQYKEFVFEANQDAQDILIAFLSVIGFDDFLQDNDILKAYTQNLELNEANLFNEIEWDSFMEIDYKILETRIVAKENWNQKWEQNYEPVVINDKCVILAPFHTEFEEYEMKIRIEPKMSFGTGHHSTTWLMANYLFENELNDKIVLDMGSGTGVLGIIASKLGAKSVVLIDNEDWAYENSLENIAKNECKNMESFLGGEELIKGDFDLIVANINLHIILQQLKTYSKHLNSKGDLFLSGFYVNDVNAIMEEAAKHNLKFVNSKSKEQWASIQMVKD